MKKIFQLNFVQDSNFQDYKFWFFTTILLFLSTSIEDKINFITFIVQSMKLSSTPFAYLLLIFIIFGNQNYIESFQKILDLNKKIEFNKLVTHFFPILTYSSVFYSENFLNLFSESIFGKIEKIEQPAIVHLDIQNDLFQNLNEMLQILSDISLQFCFPVKQQKFSENLKTIEQFVNFNNQMDQLHKRLTIQIQKAIPDFKSYLQDLLKDWKTIQNLITPQP